MIFFLIYLFPFAIYIIIFSIQHWRAFYNRVNGRRYHKLKFLTNLQRKTIYGDFEFKYVF